MKRLWPVLLAALAAAHSIWVGNHAGFIVALYFGVIYAAWLGWTANSTPPPDLGTLTDVELRRLRDRHQHKEPVR